MDLRNNSIRLTKIFEFQTAHCLFNYEGACRNIHGHSYKLYVTIGGKPIHAPMQPDDGMLMDFKVLKGVVQKNILEIFDHALVLNSNMPAEQLQAIRSLCLKLCLLPFQPTCENLISYIATILHVNLPEGVVLKKLKLHETDTSYAEWLSEENV